MSKILHSFTLDKKSSDLIKDDEKVKISADLERGEIAPYQRRHLQRTIGLLNCQIDELRAENEALKSNRFKFWKKFS